MDLNTQITGIVDGIVEKVEQGVAEKVDKLIVESIKARLSTFDFTDVIKQAATDALDKKASEYAVDSKKLEARIFGRINETITEVQKQTDQTVKETVDQRIKAVDFGKAVVDATSIIVKDQLEELVFPDASIKPDALDMTNYKFSGDNIHGGVITEFSSTGIDDRSTNIAVTILDDVTVVENNLLTKDLTVQGNVTINGTLDKDCEFYQELIDTTSTNTVNKLDKTLFDGFSKTVFNTIKDKGLDLNKITVDGRDVIVGNALGSNITNSNLQELGMLKELQVSGEAFISESLYTVKGRVGVNTFEPSSALAVWDQEIEITTGKKEADVGRIGTPRQQSLVLSANNKNNITLNTDGSATVEDLRLGQTMRFTEGDRAPNYASTKGHVVWNNNPSLGGPLGWICLGNANWANFGIID
tara:strand:+ start:205 stop:1449 length:1245 start_codon:yes stop_codon:yes gene_type:complete